MKKVPDPDPAGQKSTDPTESSSLPSANAFIGIYVLVLKVFSFAENIKCSKGQWCAPFN